MRNKLNFRLASMLVVALAMVASACTKSKELKNNVDPDAYVSKADIQGKIFHLSRGVEDADSDNTVEATPGMSEDYGLVKARITEGELQFISVYDPNGRESTNAIVASYKISKHFDIQRDKNDYGDQTNKIVEDTTNPWDHRAYMRVDWANPTNSLSKYASSLSSTRGRTNGDGDDDSSAKPSLSEENTSLLEDPKFEKGHISFVVETSVHDPSNEGTYTFPMSEQRAKSYRVVYRTHLMEAGKSDYQPVPYTLKDFERFGYFFTQEDIQDPHGLLEKNQHLFANMHNVCEAGHAGSCSTNRIRWVLSKDFPEKYKAVARKVVQEWNVTFQQALNRKDDVVYLDESTQATISDPTQNVLAYYPSRTKSGLLGVAQWVSDPRTGELVGVRATIYGDGIDYEVATVDDKINLLVSDDPLKDVIGTSGFGDPLTYVSPFDDRNMAKSIVANEKVLGLGKKKRSGLGASPLLQVKTAQSQMDSTPDKATARAIKLVTKVPNALMSKESALIAEDKASMAGFPTMAGGLKIPNLNGMEQIMFAEAKYESDRNKILHDAEHGIHGTDLVEDAAIRYLYSYLKKGATKKDLEANRQRIEDEIAQLTFYTTALHEMGHAFGLRHNFAGSADQAHFPKEYQDIAAKLAAGDTSVVKEDLDPYAASSIMDYTRDFFDQKNGLGSYDKAAIKYAYNRSINKESDPVTLAHYMFCTDHQVNESLLCQRFDKGHNVSEMVQGNIDLYDHNYALWHYRRGRISEDNANGWGSPGALVGRLINVFMPIRQSMDEFLYSLIAAQPTEGDGLCGYKYVKASIAAGEMKSICNADEMDAAHVDPSDLSTLRNALMNFDKNGVPSLMKSPSTYIPYGMADLLYANSLSMNFFQRVLGAPEPGTYLAVPQADGTVSLQEVDASQPIPEQAASIAEDQGLDAKAAAGWIKNSANFVTEIKVGGYGRQLDSRTSTTGGWIRNESLGSYYDKVAAIKILAYPGIFARKYMSDSMVGNAYVFPQTKPWTSVMMKKLITGDDSIASVPVTLKGGQRIQATVPAASNLDLQSAASVFAIALMSSDTDKSMISKLQICDINQGECSSSATGGKTVEFHSADGGNIYRAVQTTNNDSIAFDLVSDAKALDDSRATWVKVRDGAGQAQAENLLLLDKSDGVLTKILEEIAADPTLSKALPDKQHTWAQLLPGEWQNMKELTKQLDGITTNNGYSVGTEIIQAFQVLSNQTNAALTAMGTAGQCWVQTKHPEAIVKDNSGAAATNLDAIIDSTLNNDPVANAVAASGLGNAPAKLNCGVAGNSDPVDDAAGDTAESVAGKQRLNLLTLQADLKTVQDQFLTKVVVTDVKTLLAPTQINSLTNKLNTKEATIDRIRELIYSATH